MTFHVMAKTTTMTERFVTNRTNMRAFTSVNSLMYSQIILLLEGFPTGRTGIRCFFEESWHCWWDINITIGSSCVVRQQVKIPFKDVVAAIFLPFKIFPNPKNSQDFLLNEIPLGLCLAQMSTCVSLGFVTIRQTARKRECNNVVPFIWANILPFSVQYLSHTFEGSFFTEHSVHQSHWWSTNWCKMKWLLHQFFSF